MAPLAPLNRYDAKRALLSNIGSNPTRPRFLNVKDKTRTDLSQTDISTKSDNMY
jgi:hypothetical protein